NLRLNFSKGFSLDILFGQFVKDNFSSLVMGWTLGHTYYGNLDSLDPLYKKVISTFLDSNQRTKLSSSTINSKVWNIGLDGSSSEKDMTTQSYNSNLKIDDSGLDEFTLYVQNVFINSLRDTFAENSGLTNDQIKTILKNNVHYNTQLKYIEILPRAPFINVASGTKQLILIGHTKSRELYNLSNNTITWTSATPGVATISTLGVITAVANGTSIITGRITSFNPNITTTALLTITGQ
ncbi:MAG: hypothetical protein WC934_12570, partial [Acidithiobacillus sp.]|uniref:hypothetical protein n=1 Tax=Acidithiobacillus sp. TaxID=1872118 RepID=UPI00355DEC12